MSTQANKNKLSLSSRSQSIVGSKSVELSAMVHSLKKEGHDIIGMNVGEPDFDTHEEILHATKDALFSGRTKYDLVPGLEVLRKELSKRLTRNFGREVKEADISISNGSKQVLYNIFQLIIDPGDEVLIPIPYWVSFPESIKLAGGVPRFVPSDKLRLDLGELEKAVSPKTKAVVINSPNNPSGIVYSKEELELVADFAKKHDLFIIADEAYETLIYDGKKHIHMAAISDDAWNRTLTVQSFSKTFCMTGFRVGYVIGPASILKEYNKLQSHITGNNCTFAQYGALHAITMNEGIFDDMLKIFSKRRDLAYGLAKEIFDVHKPEGAFYLYPSTKRQENHFPDDVELAKHILNEAKVAILPGTYFGNPGYIRFSFTVSEERIEEAFARIKKVL